MIRIGNVAGHHLTRSGDIDGGCDVDEFHEFTTAYPGGTMIRLRHSGLQPADVRELHCSGWERTSTGWHAVRLEKTLVQTVMACSPLIPLVPRLDV